MRRASIRRSAFLLALLVGTSVSAGSSLQGFRLASDCPRSFELMDGTCRLRTLYDLYASPAGFGGLRVPMPPTREAFSPQWIDLGRMLFFDPLLSESHDISCAHCHHPDHGFADGLGRSIGQGGRGWGPRRIGGEVLPRGAPSLWNVAFLEHLDWDGHASSLEEQANQPLFSSREMATTPEHLEAALSASPIYVGLFAQASNDPELKHIQTSMVQRALAAFESSLISVNSRYDQYAHGKEGALTEQEIRGLNLFRSFTMRCSQCHTPPLFTNGDIAVIGAPDSAGTAFDAGAGGFSPDPTLRGAFEIPTLRNIALTAPYMHSGALHTLRDVVDFYNDRRGHSVPEGEHLLIHWHVALEKRTLSDSECEDLVAFLRTLTDESLKPSVPGRVPSGLAVVGRDRIAADRSID